MSVGVKHTHTHTPRDFCIQLYPFSPWLEPDFRHICTFLCERQTDRQTNAHPPGHVMTHFMCMQKKRKGREGTKKKVESLATVGNFIFPARASTALYITGILRQITRHSPHRSGRKRTSIYLFIVVQPIFTAKVSTDKTMHDSFGNFASYVNLISYMCFFKWSKFIMGLFNCSCFV